MMTRKKLVLASTGIIALTGALHLGFRLTAKDQQQSQKSQVVGQAKGEQKKKAGTVEQMIKATATNPSGEVVESPQAEAATVQTFKFQRELGDYAYLKRKVLLTDGEREEMKRLLTNDPFVKSLGALLMVKAGDDFESKQQQNLAMDLLFEALQQDDRGVAAEVLRDVIQDAGVENTALSYETRKSLAGVKAEVLFYWTAKDPERADEIRSWLPGPVSEKIWDNVAGVQRNNLEESSLEVNN